MGFVPADAGSGSGRQAGVRLHSHQACQPATHYLLSAGSHKADDGGGKSRRPRSPDGDIHRPYRGQGNHIQGWGT